jgi:hypothetical protein
MPISEQAPEFRIIGATMSDDNEEGGLRGEESSSMDFLTPPFLIPRFNAWTGPTVAASSPVPSHAFEITP